MIKKMDKFIFGGKEMVGGITFAMFGIFTATLVIRVMLNIFVYQR